MTTDTLATPSPAAAPAKPRSHLRHVLTENPVTLLAAGIGHVGRAEFEVQRVVAEALLGGAAAGGEMAVLDLAVLPGIGRAAVEEDDGTFRRFGFQGGAAALDFLELLLGAVEKG